MALAKMSAAAVQKAKPVLLEPMMAVDVITPEEYMGEVIGDVNARRGQVHSMEDRSGAKVVKAFNTLFAGVLAAGQVGGEKLRREQAGRGVGQPRSAYAVQRPTRHLLATMRAGEA